MRIRLTEGIYEVDWLSLELVRNNAETLRARGLFERALLAAFIETNHVDWSFLDLKNLFKAANPERLRAADDPLPGPKPFALYRGMAGKGRRRRIRGLSWTSAIDQARWFAQERARRESQLIMSPDPGVYRVVVIEPRVLTYLKRKEEQEFIVLLQAEDRVKRVE